MPKFFFLFCEIYKRNHFKYFTTNLYNRPFQGKEDDHVNFSKKIWAFTLVQMSKTCTNTYTKWACPHVYMSVFFFKSFFFLMRVYTCEQSVIWHPWTKCFQCQHTQLHWAVSHKEASHVHGKGHALSGSSRISSRDNLRRCGMHSSRGSQHPQLTNQKVLSQHWSFHLDISKIPVWEPQNLPRNAPRNYLETSALSSCMRKWSPREIKAFCSGFT